MVASDRRQIFLMTANWLWVLKTNNLNYHIRLTFHDVYGFYVFNAPICQIPLCGGIFLVLWKKTLNRIDIQEVETLKLQLYTYNSFFTSEIQEDACECLRLLMEIMDVTYVQWNPQLLKPLVSYISPQLNLPPCRNYWCRSINKNYIRPVLVEGTLGI